MKMPETTTYVSNQLHFSAKNLGDLAEKFGTPLYVYSAEIIRKNYREIRNSFEKLKPTIAYSVKANTNGAILSVLKKEGAAFDIVSGGELARVRNIGVTGERIIFAGVGKSKDEIHQALEADVREFNVESFGELERINSIAREMGKVAPISVRVNPDVDAKTHQYISTGKKENKFGVSLIQAREAIAAMKSMGGVRFEGLHVHIGSQILASEPHQQSVAVLDDFLEELKREGSAPKVLNAGGGFGIAYRPEEKALDLKVVAASLESLAMKHGLELMLEPGRRIVGPAGVLVTKVEYLKRGQERNFMIVDAAMTELIRPALYDGWHGIVPVRHPDENDKRIVADVVGPVCETADFLGLERELPEMTEGDLLAILNAGAYGSVMASHYNSRPKVAEVLIDGKSVYLIRERETWRDIVAREVNPFRC